MIANLRVGLATLALSLSVPAMAQMGGRPTDISGNERAYPKWVENPGKLYGQDQEDQEDLAYELVIHVRRSGFVCTTVSQTGPRPFAEGWNLYCDDFSHAYVLEPSGNLWTVTTR